MSAHYDIVVLGTGPGGYAAVIRATQLGAARGGRRGGLTLLITMAAAPCPT